MFKPVIDNKKFLNGSHIGEYAQIGDLRMHYVEKGSGEAVLLVHGIGQSLYTWHNNFRQLAEKYRVIAVDLLGFGFSDHPDISYSPEEMAESLRLFLEALNISRAHVIAFSSGCVYALALAEKYPMMVDRMVLIAPGGLLQKTNLFWLNSLMGRAFSRTAASMISRNKVAAALDEAFFDKTVLTDEVIDQYYLPLAEKESRFSLAAAIAALDETEVVDGLRTLKNHVLVLSAGDDPWRSEEEIDSYISAIAHCYSIKSLNCGHMLHEEKFEKFNANVIDFLDWNGRIV